MIKVKEITINYKSFKMNFSDILLRRNQVTFIEGKNGSGKTTLLKSISGLQSYKGEIIVDGEVTYSSQEPVIFHMSALENILYPIRIRKWDTEGVLEQVKEYSELFEIDHLLHEDATKFSSGEKMKIAIIRSVIFNPDYVLLDEPTTHLDLDSIEVLINLIQSLKEKITFVIVSHNKQFMDALQERIIHLGGSNV